jgi:hypothetical protein
MGMTTEPDLDREFWLGQRSGLLKQVEAIERRYLPDKFQERLAFRRWVEDKRREKVHVVT